VTADPTPPAAGDTGTATPSRTPRRRDRRGVAHTINELADDLRVSSKTLHRWIRSGELRAVNLGQEVGGKPRIVVLPADLEDFLRRRAVGPAPKPRRPRRTPKLTEGIDFYPD
jgi:excisionase family DNA binding protein